MILPGPSETSQKLIRRVARSAIYLYKHGTTPSGAKKRKNKVQSAVLGADAKNLPDVDALGEEHRNNLLGRDGHQRELRRLEFARPRPRSLACRAVGDHHILPSQVGVACTWHRPHELGTGAAFLVAVGRGSTVRYAPDRWDSKPRLKDL